ncbi:P-loop containing nucleoside triphosphate hydrolase protein, partial [Schizophyllum commune]
LDFDLPAELGDWHVYLSSHAYRDIRKTHREDKSRYNIIVAKIQQLSNGHFSNDNQKRLTQTGARVPIYEAKLTRDSRLVYQVDCVADAKVMDFSCPLIRLYGVYTHAQMDDRLRSIFDAIGVEVGRRGKEYQRRCVFRLPPVNAGDNVFSPATFPLGEDVLQKEYEDVQLPPEDKARVHELIKLEKYFLFSQVRIVADIDAAHVFHLTDKEREIVGHAGSCYVLGRSGTGKTTTMLYKMLGIERAQRINGEGTSRTVRQLFVTQSHVLVEKVQEAYDKLAKSLHVEVSSKQDLMALKEERPGTRRDYLIKNDTKTVQKEMSVQRFSELTDQHFPLFLTYDKLCTLLEGDVLPSEEHLIGEDFSDLTPRIMQRTGQLVTYRLFFTEYWPHFSQTLTKGLDPALVFSEIMGVIKGSEEASALPSHSLSREGYESLSRRRQSTFASCRNVVYDIFVQYDKEKARRGDYDAADRTFNVLRILRGQGTAGGKIDYLYVDEVQDNLLIDARVLRHITRFANGLFWAGDTAQTISVGSAFRFNDLKAYLHRLEEKHNSAIDRRPPRSFQLTTNYRSHAGIVDCAQTVIDLITTYWPDSIDQLAREEGEVAGVKPVFLTGWSSDTLCYEQFLFTTSGNAIEFGAKQCILVRHEEARRRLRSRVGNIGLIMTLYQSKGLEFDDVILYDFFQDSLVTAAQWRMVLNHMSPDYRPRIPAPRFEETLHAGVCSELKFLYVAITRARKNVWIVDTSERAEPMRLLWTSWNRIDNRTPANVPRLAVSSTRKEWEEEGIELFKSEHYDEARFCYERAGMLVEMAIAHAYYLHVCAALKPSDGSRSAILERRKAFLDAATAFIGCAETAGASGLPERQKAYYRVAANAYLDANDDANAARIFVEAGEFLKGAEIYRRLGNFDEVVNIVQAHGSHMDTTSKSRLLHVCRLYYFQAKQYRKACDLFGSLEEALQFLEETPFNFGKAALLESACRFREAAELQIVDNPAHAVDLFFVDAADNLAVERGWDCISDGLWTEFAFG